MVKLYRDRESVRCPIALHKKLTNSQLKL